MDIGGCYRLARVKGDPNNFTIWLGICTQEDHRGFEVLLGPVRFWIYKRKPNDQ